MGDAEKAAVRRFVRNAISLLISSLVAYFTEKPYLLALAPVINAGAKWLRSKFKLPLLPI